MNPASASIALKSPARRGSRARASAISAVATSPGERRATRASENATFVAKSPNSGGAAPRDDLGRRRVRIARRDGRFDGLCKDVQGLRGVRFVSLLSVW